MTESALPRADARGGRLVARRILLDDRHVLDGAEIVWDRHGRIVRLRRCRERPADVVVLPGLVDAHCHLQIAPLRASSRAFVPWASAVMAARAVDDPRRERERTLAAARDLLADGVTAVGDIDATGRGFDALAATGLAGRSYRELTGFHLDAVSARSLVRQRSNAARGDVHAGLSPHAPYSVSPALFTAALRTRRHLAIHCAETAEEQEFLRAGTGPFRELLERLGRLPEGFRPPRVGAVRWLERLGVLGPRTQLVHCQELERGDIARIARSGASIVVCPGTISWFGRTPPPVPRWLAAGIPVGLGTDSRASNREWSMRAELALAARWWPELSPARRLAMATTYGAAAIGRQGLARLRRGGRADFVVVRSDGDVGAAMERFVGGASAPLAVVAGGRAVGPRALRR